MSVLEILAVCEEIKRQEGVQIHLVTEVGSRLWGWAREDSDYDVRFVYSEPRLNYLDPGRHIGDTFTNSVTLQDGTQLDLHGWDIMKFAGHLLESNPSAFEWLNSKDRYFIDTATMGIENYCRYAYQTKPLIDHYRGIATSHWRKYVQAIATEANLSPTRYLHIIRALLMADVLAVRNTFAPLPMTGLTPVAPSLREQDRRLIYRFMARRKRDGGDIYRDHDIENLIARLLNNPVNFQYATGRQHGDEAIQMIRRYPASVLGFL